MSSEQSVAGDCPHCRAAVPRSRVIIEYETDAGPGVYAECPECEDVVAPT
ncbi:hypothetical protein [Halovivax sp.]|nr:hypothetical protein [Halovivax sp.]